jgi:hypothetical protein
MGASPPARSSAEAGRGAGRLWCLHRAPVGVGIAHRVIQGAV